MRITGLKNSGRDVSSPAIWATKISAHFGDNNVAQMSRSLNGQICSHTPSALKIHKLGLQRAENSNRREN